MTLQRKTPLRATYSSAIEAQCPTCGDTFMSYVKTVGRTKYCSRKCQHATLIKPRGRCTVCGKPVPYQPSSKRKTCSRACASEAKARAKRGANNPLFRGDASVKAREARWHQQRANNCVRCGGSGVGQEMHQHHVIYRQEVKRHGGDIWDVRNGLTLCLPCHTSHHNQNARRLTLKLLPNAAFEYAVQLMGAGPAYEYLRRRYAGEDRRLDRLLAEWEVAT